MIYFLICLLKVDTEILVEKEHTIQGEGELEVIQKFVEERMTPL